MITHKAPTTTAADDIYYDFSLNQLTVMCMTRGERRLINTLCQKESAKSKPDGQTGLHSA